MTSRVQLLRPRPSIIAHPLWIGSAGFANAPQPLASLILLVPTVNAIDMNANQFFREQYDQMHSVVNEFVLKGLTEEQMHHQKCNARDVGRIPRNLPEAHPSFCPLIGPAWGRNRL